jgi:hypothetical protein
MSQTAITLAFEQWKASQAVTGEAVLLDEFVFASVPGLDVSKPIDRNEALPPAAQIVHRQAVSRKGVVNDNAVVHSVVLGAEVGDFSFNWVGLINKASNTLAMIVHAPLQQKLKTKDGQQGNVLTRSFLMEYDGAQSETGINTPAETWQIDFTARMAGMDERQRLENIDLYGAAAFLGDGYLVAKNGSQFYVTAGAGYVRGLRAQLAANQNITVTTKPVKVWLDVAWTGTLTSAWSVTSKITVAANLTDYAQNGVQHYVYAVASIDANGNITDLRPKGTLNDQTASDALKKHEQSRNHPDATTAAKGFTQLSSATDSVSESMAATPKAVKAVFDLANAKYTAQDATTGQKGIVQLSSSLASTSETQAATPKAIKAVNDELVKVRDSLGTASKADVVTSTDDITPGRVPVVGWKGLGAVRDARAADESLASFWRDLTQVKSGITIPYDGSPTVSYLAVDGANQHAYIGRRRGAEAIAWVKIYSEFYKPSTKDIFSTTESIGAAADLNDYVTPGIYYQGANANAVNGKNYPEETMSGSLAVYKNAGGITQVYRIYSTSRCWSRSLYNGTWSAWAKQYDTVNKPSAEDVDAVSASGGGTFQKGIAVKGNGANVSLWSLSAGQATYVLGKDFNGDNVFYIGRGSSNFNVSFYNYKANTGISLSEDGSAALTLANGKAFTVNSQVIPANYANFDARYALKSATVIDVRQGSPGTIVLTRNGWNYVPGGCAFTGWYVEGDAPVGDTIQYKPLQININGAWRTISG